MSKISEDPIWKPLKTKKALCELCGSDFHYSTFCYLLRKKTPKKEGKQALKWRSERKIWMEKHPPEEDGFWYCHYCGVKMVGDKDDLRYKSGEAMFLTVDHIVPRSNSPKKRYDFNNMVPCCYVDNVLKGSVEYVRFCERYYPQLLVDSDNGHAKLPESLNKGS